MSQMLHTEWLPKANWAFESETNDEQRLFNQPSKKVTVFTAPC